MFRSVIPVALFSLIPAFVPSADSILQAALTRLAGDAPGTAGISVLHIESGASAAVNGDQWFPMMSVYKLPIAIHALRRIDSGELNVEERVTLTAADRRPGFSPIGESIAAKGPVTLAIRDVLTAVITKSDNTASDWLLRRVGGPAAGISRSRSF